MIISILTKRQPEINGCHRKIVISQNETVTFRVYDVSLSSCFFFFLIWSTEGALENLAISSLLCFCY